MGLMILAGAEQSGVLWILLTIAMGLTWWEARDQELDRRLTLWWILLVALVHIPGYLALRLWGAWRKQQAQA